MVFILPFVGAAALFSGWALAMPRPDSALGEEVGVSAPNGIVMSDTVELASQLATATPYGSTNNKQGGGYGANVYGGGSNNYPATTTTAAPYSTPTYGSGGSNWGSGYDDCVSQCVAKFGAPVATYTPSATSGSSGSSGTGATHTVIVAPTQGVLRYVPFAVNASVGDTIKFMWGANNHTVTKSSALLPCNKSSDALFTSGTQNKDFVFTQVVNDTKPTFFYCGTPTHCQKGMFGIINPPNAFGAPSSFSSMVENLGTNNSAVGAYTSITKEKCANNTGAARWGGNIDLSALPTWSHPSVAENILFTRNFLATNPEVLKDNGVIDLSNSASTPLMIPPDVAATLNSDPAPNAASSSSSSPAGSSPTPTPQAGSQANGASFLASPRALVGLATLVPLFFAL
jgi:plastocyanin